jgi:hypothetical protein
MDSPASPRCAGLTQFMCSVAIGGRRQRYRSRHAIFVNMNMIFINYHTAVDQRRRPDNSRDASDGSMLNLPNVVVTAACRRTSAVLLPVANLTIAIPRARQHRQIRSAAELIISQRGQSRCTRGYPFGYCAGEPQRTRASV